MKRGIKTIMISAAALLALISVLAYADYRSVRIGNESGPVLYRRLLGALSEGPVLRMRDITPFEWDHLYVFQPYTTRGQMEQKVGRRWTTSRSFAAYVAERLRLGNDPLKDATQQKLVFVKQGIVVAEVTLDRTESDFVPALEPLTPETAAFVVEGHRILPEERRP
ncbi:hypothetical protein ACE6ED_24225 [Paenibacillus sp. CN-4]|uniref:hypothetical protein n=1 Tax=Paenibacillus nanchangensis TaxID=3348343 RepID=UPI00397851C7